MPHFLQNLLVQSGLKREVSAGERDKDNYQYTLLSKTSSSSTAGGLKDVGDETVLQELVDAAKESGGEPASEDESP